MSSLPQLVTTASEIIGNRRNGLQSEYETRFKAGTIAEAFLAQAEDTPHSTAVVCHGEQISYHTLNKRANQIAHYLRERGIGPESMVGIFMDRSVNAVAAITGVLKSGGAYVPIDPVYPRDRIEFILQDASIDWILTEESLASKLPEWGGKPIIVEREWAEIDRQPEENLPCLAGPSNAAYVIYTSGSTGRPKGVVVTNHNVVRLFGATDDFFRFSGADVWTLFHSFTFDLSVWEMWGALFYGGKLVVVPYLTSRSPEAFYELLSEHRVTSLTQTPSAFRQLIWADESAERKLPLALKHVVLAGEALELQSLRPWFKRHGDSEPRIINMYGITETTVHVTERQITMQDVESGLGSVIGEPMSDLKLYILDENQQPARAGEAGEIYVGGPGVARGYLNRPELNEKRFINNPLTRNPEDKVYRSGDLARRLENGEIEYLGRMDDQVKIRGFRVELGEIQTALNSHPGIRASVILAQTPKDQPTRLLAYFVTRNGSIPVEELREYLKKSLPEYMVPAWYMAMEKIPLTLNGKVDRKALPSPDGSRPELAVRCVAASTPREKALAAIWQETLELTEVGVHDNFFALGGDSIRSIQILSKARAAGVRVSLATLFDHPTIYELARAQEEGTDDSGKESGVAFEMIPPADAAKMPDDVVDAYPMSKLQLGMVFHTGYEPRSAMFHDVFTYRIGFPLDGEKFRRALGNLTERHDILRTSFELAKYSEPLQLVHGAAVPAFTMEDMSGLGVEEQRRQVVDWVEAEKRRPFDWSKPPFARFHAMIRSGDSFQLAVSFYHGILDGWSLAAMLTELMQEYCGLLRGQPITLISPAVRYREFIHFEQEAIRSKEAREFWPKKLAGAVSSELPRWPAACRKGGLEQVRSRELMIAPEVLEKLKALGQMLKVPLKTVLLAAHCRVMSLISGQREITTGLIANGRPQSAGGERMLGLFLNALPFRIDLRGRNWKQLVEGVFTVEKEMIPHRRFPLAEIKQLTGDKLKLETAFDFVQFHTLMDVPGFRDGKFVEDHYFEANDFTLYATFMLSADASQLEVHFDYDPNEICPEQAELISDYYSGTLAAIAGNPEAPALRQCVLPKRELEKLLVDWNRTAQEYPRQLIHELFEAQVKSTPDRPAAVFHGQTVSYRKLNERANALAGMLRAKGAGPGTVAAICLERSLEMLIGVLAVLKTGAAYLPLDPSYPAERLSWMLTDCEAKVLLTQQGLVRFFEAAACEIAFIEALAQAAIPNEKTSDTPLIADAESPAYVIYTSGSTGKPKGVQVPHRAVVNFLSSMREKIGIRADDRWLAVTTLSFDIAGMELLLPLVTGAAVVIADGETVVSAPMLAKALSASGITIMQATPVTWRNLIESGWQGKPDLKAICGGEKLDIELARKLKAAAGELWNMYGPTETTIWSTAEKLTDITEEVPIGRPIGNTEILILDEEKQATPTGTDGEIHIGGAGLALGYLKQRELTQERFIAHPFRAGDRLYRTGDMGRYLPDGRLIVSGRMDDQVKIYGHRIELGEIESALLEHPKVRGAAVQARECPGGERRLVAYWLERGAGGAAASSLRGFLEEKLPRFMVPSVYVRLESLPLTGNGKIDRKRLPDPEVIENKESQREIVGARTPLEKMVVAAWREGLKADQIGIKDDFFHLGGDSLRAAQITSKLSEQLGLSISFAAVFQHRTAEALAVYLMNQLIKRRELMGVETTGAGEQRP